MNNTQNLSFSLHEKNSDNDENISYDELMIDLDEKYEQKTKNDEYNDLGGYYEDIDQYETMDLNYNTNFTKKQLERIAEYYEISKRKKNKQELIVDIILFELNPENEYIAFKRKQLWEYMKEIKADKYLSKFLILD
tara:strand:- start:278 stop:685 length:408 start_codon:yes stop_codon:yes gene_type:complete